MSSPQRIYHLLALHLYQPPGTLQQLLLESEAELQRLLGCYERIARDAHKYADVAQLHVVFSIPLLRQLKDPAFIDKTRHLGDIPGILESFRSAPNIEFIASGLQHAPLPLIPTQDWDAQLRSERSLIEDSFGHQPKGYYPPGGLFDEAMIPHLTATGYRFALLPSSALITNAGNPVDPYRVYRLKGDFAVVPIDDGFSHALGNFVEAPWFADEVVNGTRIAPESASPYVVTTLSDGEGGEWFRRLDEENGFFGRFFAPYMEFCETGEYPIRPVNVVEYLRQAKPEPAQLAEQELQARDHPALQQLQATSALFWEMTRDGVNIDPSVRELILLAEGSCFVLDEDPGYAKMTALLKRIAEQLESVKTGTAPKTPGKDSLAAASRNGRRTASMQTAKRPAAQTALVPKPGDASKNARATLRQSGNQTTADSEKPGTKKRLVTRKKAVKSKKSTGSKDSKDDSG